jgi:hypothetical protein
MLLGNEVGGDVMTLPGSVVDFVSLLFQPIAKKADCISGLTLE